LLNSQNTRILIQLQRQKKGVDNLLIMGICETFHASKKLGFWDSKTGCFVHNIY